nr:palindromic element RPE2 domain-containing protein [Rickettsia endosymbiont of Oedothorax gibbosus]
MVNSGEFGARSDGATPISNRRALSDDVTNFSSIDYIQISFKQPTIYKLCKKLDYRVIDSTMGTMVNLRGVILIFQFVL